ncbi:hypothetical protein [Ruminococcus sp.]|uniref:hypothetical protein n=1 Tax=Ruminococcus sp. TaxID=41978 RepID=UPI0025DAD8CA|nr:hypothetical protein [Ruminococcus sp.]MBQ8965617.1 hypothetical protein [Ruminococcus sp.]
MFSIAAAVLAVVLIVLERTGKLNLQKKGGAFGAMLAAALMAGFYFADCARFIAALGVKFSGWTGDEGEARAFGSTSTGLLVVRGLLLLICIVPAAGGLIYTLQALVRKSAERELPRSDHFYGESRVKGLISRGTVAAIGFIAFMVIMVLCLLPYMDRLLASFVIFNPMLLLFITVFTLGLALLPIVGLMISMNGMFMLLCFGIGSAGLVFYLFSAILSAAAAVLSAKYGLMQKSRAVLYGLLGLIPGWNLLALWLMKKDIS